MTPTWISQADCIRPLLIASDRINTNSPVISTMSTFPPHGQKMAAAAPDLKSTDI